VSKKRIVLIEDDADTRLTMAAALDLFLHGGSTGW
jgi:hypothetical protein